MSDEDDEVVAEMDVYLCKGTLPEGSKMYLLQSPLRPPWRPYDLDSAEDVQMKPGAGRLQMDLPLAQAGPNVHVDAEPAKQMRHLRLVSSPAALPTSFAVGVVRDGKLLLVPVDEALQLRPSLAHLNKPAALPGGPGADAEEEDQKPELQAVKVSVQRRETERQAEARLKSYSHHAKQETEEPWVKLRLHSADSDATATVWNKLTKPPEAKIDMSLSRAEYLESIVPGSGIEGAGTGGSGWRGGDGPHPMDLGAPDAAPQQAGYQAAMPMQSLAVDPEGQVPAAVVPALRAALSQLLARHSVINLKSLRRFLRHSRDQGLQQAATAGDRHLGELLKAQPDVTVVCGSFVANHTGDGRDDALRRVVLDLMRDPEPIRRADVQKAAKAAGIEWVDSSYHRVMKAVGKNNNNAWTLQDGDVD